MRGTAGMYITPEQGMRLREAVNQYREQFGLPSITAEDIWVNDAILYIKKLIDLELRVRALEMNKS